MAKKKSKARRSSGRRRMGAVPGGANLQILLGAVGGAIASRFITKAAAGLDPKVATAVNVVKAAAGYFAFGQTNPFVKGAGVGLFVAGSMDIATGFGLLNGIAGTPVVFRQLTGAPQRNVVPEISGAADYVGNTVPPEIALISGIYDDYS
jgi:hypothetical protein